MLSLVSRVRLGDVTDGTSSTLFVGERGVFRPSDGELPAYSPDLCGMNEMESWLRTVALTPASAVDPSSRGHFWSHHPGGVHFLFGDGRVQFVSYSISQTTFRALATGASSEIISDY
ncbi:MAG: DUF1559 domain-containing protein [Planctomycetes bacterium]|nr:DUF1559 domain-containing protein [Planctomycetota bacterium]